MDALREALEAQVGEVELLRSMFPGAQEVEADEASAVAFLSEGALPPPPLRVCLRLAVGELSAELPPLYPRLKPLLIFRPLDTLSRQRAADLNLDMRRYLLELPDDEPCLYSVVCWLQDNVAHYETEKVAPVPSDHLKAETYSRLWIYSHHIYSTTKRKTILAEAQRLNLTGFCLPGKPGIVCIEGEADACDEWWSQIKAMNWKKIVVKTREDFASQPEFTPKFTIFQEVSFQSKNPNMERHADMGELYRYLNEHDCAYAFVEYFGVDGRPS